MIRVIKKSDIKNILPLIELMYNQHQREIPYFMDKLNSVEILEKKLEQMMNLEGFHQFVYEFQGKLIGYMDMSIHNAHLDLMFPYESSIFLDTLVVDIDYRGQDFASEMIYFAQNFAKELGFKTMQLHALTAFPKLNTYYQKFGFKNIATYMTCNL